jgi:hypothetical protein
MAAHSHHVAEQEPARRNPDGREAEDAMSAGEAPVTQAVQWIDDQLRDNPQADRPTLVDEASRRFDLSPLDADFLYRHLAARGRPS